MKRTIWTDKSFREDVDEKRQELSFEDGGMPESDLEIKACSIIESENKLWFEDEVSNMARYSPDTLKRVFALGDIGRWDGRFKWYDIYEGGLETMLTQMPSDILESEFFVEDGEVKAELRHHDSTHYVIYRGVKEDMCIDELAEMILGKGEFPAQEIIEKYTFSLAPTVCGLYGWDDEAA